MKSYNNKPRRESLYSVIKDLRCKLLKVLGVSPDKQNSFQKSRLTIVTDVTDCRKKLHVNIFSETKIHSRNYIMSKFTKAFALQDIAGIKHAACRNKA